MHKQLKQAINLSRKTGDRLIVYDLSQNDSAFVVMNLDEYEKLVFKRHEIHSLTEDELLDKINRDIAIWKAEQFNPIPLKSRRVNYVSDRVDDVTEKFDSLDSASSKLRRVKKSSQWEIPNERKENAEEVIEEDRQYLEEVDF